MKFLKSAGAIIAEILACFFIFILVSNMQDFKTDTFAGLLAVFIFELFFTLRTRIF